MPTSLNILDVKFSDFSNRLDELKGVRETAYYSCGMNVEKNKGFVFCDHDLELYLSIGDGCRIIVGCDGDEIIGYIIYFSWMPNEKFIRTSVLRYEQAFLDSLVSCCMPFIYIDQMIIKKRFSGNNKYGSKLLNFLEEKARRNEVCLLAGIIHIDNSYSLRWFNSNGYSFLDFYEHERQIWIRTIKVLQVFDASVNQTSPELHVKLESFMLGKRFEESDLFNSKTYPLTWNGCTIDVSPFFSGTRFISGFFMYNSLERVIGTWHIHSGRKYEKVKEAIRGAVQYYKEREQHRAQTVVGYFPQMVLYRCPSLYSKIVERNLKNVFGSNVPLIRLDETTARDLSKRTKTPAEGWNLWQRSYIKLADADIEAFSDSDENTIWVHYITGITGFSTDKLGHFFSSAVFPLCDIERLVNRLKFYSHLMGVDISANLLSISQEALRISNTKSAIGSIMSRNGSHNIGSHVLAALSHNVGTMPDDRVLYQYIQHRMDYIATATTEFPLWRQPTMLVSNIIREFLRQKHLLDYISSSEGLHAYNFQGHFAANEQENSIRVHVRRVEKREGWETNGYIDGGVIADFVVYPGVHGEETVVKKVDFEKDLAIAVPGGTVGNHAFFTIIENVLRNAAKHEWAVAVKYWKKLQEEKEGIERLLRSISESKWSEAAECWKRLGNPKVVEDLEGLLGEDAKSEVEKIVKNLKKRLKTVCKKLSECKPTNLDLYVDFADNPEKGVVECRVWTNIAVRNREYRESNLTVLKKSLEEKIGASFLDDETGRLRKENWGIAEMRISAGYLQGKDIADIGGLTSREKALEIIRPVIVSAGSDADYLGYRFDVYKPRELLVVIKDSRSFEEAGILADVNAKAMQYGIVFKRESEVLSAKSNPYSYILFEELNLNDLAEVKKYTDAKLPYRVLGWRVQQACDDKDKVNVPKRLQEVACYDGTFFNKDSGDVLAENLRKICDLNNDGSGICYALLEEVYRFWLDKIRRNKQDGSCRKLVLDLGLKGDKSGARKSLVSDYDLLKFVFAHTFGAAVRSFLATKNDPEVTEECAALLLAIISMPNRQLASTKELAAKYLEKSVSEVSSEDEHELLSSEYAIVYNQIEIWSEELLKCGREVVLAAEDVPQNWWVTFENRGWTVKINEWHVFAKDNDSAIDKLVEYILNIILKQAEAFLRKYEEEIATLPKGFSIESNGTSFSWEWDVGRQGIEFTCDQGERNTHVNDDFCYFRHGEKSFPNLIDSYYEALSGAQSSFNAFVPFQNAVSIVDAAEQCSKGEAIRDRLYLQNKNFVVRFMTGLVENSTFKILIIDERVKKFMGDHANVRNNMGGLGIVVRDHNDNAVHDMFSVDEGKNLLEINFSDDVSADVKKKVYLNAFDIIVIHQGVIDKLLKNHESKESVGAWLAKMESLRRYVVITTGRGTPANIPDQARVLPYSVIESSILQRFPEKMILVDTIMNLLPSVKEN